MRSRVARPPSEKLTQREIEIALGAEPGLILLKNSNGLAEHVADDGKVYTVPYGLGVGSPDLVGLLSRRMLAARIDAHVELVAVWFCLEIKREGERPTEAQLKSHRIWRSVGAFVEVVHSVQGARDALERARKGLPSNG